MGVVHGQVTGFITKERRNFIFSHSQSHPCGPGTCVGNKGSGLWGHWIECAQLAEQEEQTSNWPRPGLHLQSALHGPGFSAFKASADRPAQKNMTSEVLLHEAGHVIHQPDHD